MKEVLKKELGFQETEEFACFITNNAAYLEKSFYKSLYLIARQVLRIIKKYFVS